MRPSCLPRTPSLSQCYCCLPDHEIWSKWRDEKWTQLKCVSKKIWYPLQLEGNGSIHLSHHFQETELICFVNTMLVSSDKGRGMENIPLCLELLLKFPFHLFSKSSSAVQHRSSILDWYKSGHTSLFFFFFFLLPCALWRRSSLLYNFLFLGRCTYYFKCTWKTVGLLSFSF